MIFKDRFKGRTAIVTGGAAGIGMNVASRLAAEGATVSLWDLKGDSLANFKVELALRTTPCWT